MSKPSIVLVHGSWHGPQHFTPLIKELESYGYKCIAVSLPSTQSKDLPPASFADDQAAIRKAVISELDAGIDVVVVAHSYGGAPTTSSLKDLDTKSRTEAGEKTSVTGLALLAAALLPAGTTFLSALGGKPMPIHALDGDFTDVGAPGPEFYFYNDLSPEDAKYYSSILRPQSWFAYKGELTYEAWKDIPTSYLHCTKDQALVPPAQEGMVAGCIAAGVKIRVEKVEAGHSPFLSKVKETGDFIRRSAGEII